MISFRRLLLVALIPALAQAQTTEQKAVLVTGASSGIGRKIVERLSSQGYFVYAGARSPDDLRQLGAIKNVQAIRLDVTVPQEIEAAVETVTKAGRGLYGTNPRDAAKRTAFRGFAYLTRCNLTKPNGSKLAYRQSSADPRRRSRAHPPGSPALASTSSRRRARP